MDILDDLHQAELGPIVWIQGWPEAVRPLMELVSMFGTDMFFLLCLPVLYWCVNPAFALRLGLTVLVSGAVNAVAKLALHQPRPYWIDVRVRAFSIEGAFGLPSGHAQTGTAALGRIAAAVARPWAWWTAVALVGLVCLSRLYLGVHFISDVVVGVAFGAGVLVLVAKGERPVARWWRRQALWAQLVLAAGLSGALIVAALLVNAPYAGWVPPLSWAPAGAIDPQSVETVVTLSGVLLGTLAGTALMYRAGWFDAGGRPAVRVARWAVGTVVAGLIWYAERVVLPDTPAATYAGFALLGLWVQAGAPLLFIRLGLMSRAERRQAVH